MQGPFHRLDQVRRYCAGKGLDAFLVRDTSNIRWLTGFDGVFDTERAHALFIDRQRAVLHTDSRYAAACRDAALACGGVVSVDDAREFHAAFAARMLDGACPRSLGIEDSISLAEFRALEGKLSDSAQPSCAGGDAAAGGASGAATLHETTDAVVSLRAVKDASEIARMKAAQAITDAAFSHIVGFMRPGMTEREVQVELEGFMLRSGAEGLAFSSIVACGANGANPHAVPGDSVLQAGQCVVLDFGARAQGYCSDMTRVVFLGNPNQRMRDAYAALRRANEEVAAMLRPGVTGAQAHAEAERILEQAGFGGAMGHGLGHGVGIDIHELPNLSPRNDTPLNAGNVVTVEPGIYLPGDFGMRLEDFGVITDDGFEVFTQSTHDMVVL